MGGACGLHRQNEIHAGVDSIVSKNLEDNAKRHAGSIGSTQVTASEPVRVAPPDGIVWTCAGSTARKRHLDECGKAPLKLDRPIVRVLPVHNDGGVSRYRA